ncbi:DNA integrity scanning protein DisA [[Clostridium] sordellii]|uniref:DNA integrity scanning protein DisA n=1 Tax=Paraclostridium sordellii TaxID=1505 RepID=A0A0A8WHR5_PARSO|nr:MULTISPECIES: DNA integrity scanning diadenylate cyclase DisA [Paeniclostridium]MDU5019712.1 DNA integrity scanning diadenylate cyclase DisA [Clostridiales bacterium]AUN12827.1 DNA integrity scanning protein DisA [Paeniclostridium sordellii]EPZ61321.1 disA bacterial checkpoint controller linker region family protein [[Clostridium] sordellii VPI 9048] [Paeniclostridium sordellii VPI 9048]MBW4863397.1 DNA integrity scanning diadenylate cyclase DisA [Paeniclostridium sp.]MBW4872803.1 DNA integ
MSDFFSGKKAISTLKMISPGTSLRLGIDHVLKAKTGGLIVIADGDDVMKIVDGGFQINAEYSPAYLYELAKMDGAIVLSGDIKTILYANAQLIPDYSIETSETGTRHRTAERVAKQTGSIVIAISQRRNVITVYQDDKKYVIEDISKIFTKANQALQTLEKYKAVLDQAIISLTALEFKDLVTLYDVILVVQKIEMVMRVTNIIEKYIVELGIEGTLLSMQVDELMGTTKVDQNQILKDYKRNDMTLAEFKKKIISLSSEELLDLANIAKMIGYTGFTESMDMPVRPRGYRILNKIHRLPSTIIENLVNYFEDFQDILDATTEDLDDVEGIGEIRAKYIKNGLIKMQELSLIDRHI